MFEPFDPPRPTDDDDAFDASIGRFLARRMLSMGAGAAFVGLLSFCFNPCLLGSVGALVLAVDTFRRYGGIDAGVRRHMSRLSVWTAIALASIGALAAVASGGATLAIRLF